MTLPELTSMILTILAIGSFVFAYAEFKKWRVELLGSKRIDLAIRLGKTALDIQNEFAHARSPAKLGGDSDDQRLLAIFDQLNELYKIRWEILILLDTDINDDVEHLNGKYRQLQDAMRRKEEQKTIDEEILYRGINDAYAQEIAQITKRLMEIAKKQLR